MNTSFRHFFLSAMALGLLSAAHAQTEPSAGRDSVRINQGGYTVLEKRISEGDQQFMDKTKIVRDAYRRREIKRQKDEQALPAASVAKTRPTVGPLQ